MSRNSLTIIPTAFRSAIDFSRRQPVWLYVNPGGNHPPFDHRTKATALRSIGGSPRRSQAINPDKIWALQAFANRFAVPRNRPTRGEVPALVRHSSTMQPDLEPIEPQQVLELYLTDRRGELRESTIRSHRSRLSIFIDWCRETEGINNLNDLTGRTIHRYKVWRRAKGDINTVTLKTQIDTVRVFIKWLETIEGCPPDLHAKVKSPSISSDENARTVELHTDEAGQMLSYLSKYEYASCRHVALSLLWHTLMRRGAVRALDLQDYHQDEQYIDVVHRPATGTPLKNGVSGERLVAISDEIAALLNDWINNQRPDVVDEHGRKPLLASVQGRVHVTTIQQYAYMGTRPCHYGAECPHGRDLDTCEAAVERYSASKCPSSVSPHAIRRGSITHWLREDVPQQAVSDRADVSAEVIDAHYDERSKREKMEQRRGFLDNI